MSYAIAINKYFKRKRRKIRNTTLQRGLFLNREMIPLPRYYAVPTAFIVEFEAIYSAKTWAGGQGQSQLSSTPGLIV